MKKIIALVLTLILMLSIVACGQGTTNEPNETTDGGNGSESSTDETTGADDVTDPEGTDGSDVTEDKGTGGEETGGDSSSDHKLQDATTVDETVYLNVAGAYYRSAPDVYEKNIGGRAVWGDALHRVSYNTEWSVIVVDDVKYYLPTECVSTTQPTEEPVFTEVSDKVTVADSDVALYTAPVATETAIYVTLDEGTELSRLKSDTYWSIVTYEGYELYIETASLSDSEGSVDDIEFSSYETTVVVTASETILYSIASTDQSISESVATVLKGVELETFAISEDGLWYGVSYLDSTSGYTLNVYVQASAVAATDEMEETEGSEGIPDDGEDEGLGEE